MIREDFSKHKLFKYGKAFFLVALVVSAFALVFTMRNSLSKHSSTLSTSQLNGILESSSNCRAPCWQQLTPGISTERDVQIFLETASSPLLSTRTPYTHQGMMIYPFNYDQVEIPASFVIDNQVLVHTAFSATFANLDLILQNLGLPNTYIAAHVNDVESFINFTVLYEDKGIVVLLTSDLAMKSECILQSVNDASVSAIFLVQPNTSDQMLRDALGDLSTQREVIQKWQDSNSIHLKPCN